ncbi:MAG: type II toxin-antitoxin system Phd/YefM family antitoxin [Acidobacteria bacterium]|nr:type II toxin-antitoxin system Phd/YefM family antitoxin [Acidobacteriota bacterium]
MRQLKRTGEPIVLTVNGKAAAVLHDPESYEEYLRDRERRQMIAAVKRGIEDMKAGRTKPAAEVFRDFEKKYKIRS